MKRPRKGTRLVYTGPYAPSVPESAKYGPGTVVRTRDYGWGDVKVTVKLDDGHYADWPLEKTAPEEA